MEKLRQQKAWPILESIHRPIGSKGQTLPKSALVKVLGFKVVDSAEKSSPRTRSLVSGPH